MAIVLLAPASFAAKDKEPAGPPVQAVLLDHNEYPCVGCLFGVSDYYVCFEVQGKIVIGHEKVRTQTWQHAPVSLMERGRSVPVKLDDKFIWVPQEFKGKTRDVRMTQDYTKKIFLENDRCQAAVK